MKTKLYIDGRNFQGKIEEVYKLQKISKNIDWTKFDFKRLVSKVLQGIEVAELVIYFARIKEHPETIDKSRKLIQERRLLKRHLEQQGFKVVMSGVVRGNRTTDSTGKDRLVFKEKGVDVGIAVDMVADACDGQVSIAILASSDSDLQPAIKEVRRRRIETIYLGFEVMPNRGLTATTHRTILIRNSEVIDSFTR